MERPKLLVLFLAFSLFAASAGIGAPGGMEEESSPNLSAADVQEQLDYKSTTVIDIRSIQEYRYGHIPGAINIPSPAVKILTPKLLKDKSAPIIIYARGDSYAPTDTTFNVLFNMGYRNIKIFPGGVREWLDNHYPVTIGNEP